MFSGDPDSSESVVNMRYKFKSTRSLFKLSSLCFETFIPPFRSKRFLIARFVRKKNERRDSGIKIIILQKSVREVRTLSCSKQFYRRHEQYNYIIEHKAAKDLFGHQTPT